MKAVGWGGGEGMHGIRENGWKEGSTFPVFSNSPEFDLS
jgi:hypothetical protein